MIVTNMYTPLTVPTGSVPGFTIHDMDDELRVIVVLMSARMVLVILD